ncbi:MAG TPA: histidine kinase, partial [Pseudonocardiaceae bacterium]
MSAVVVPGRGAGRSGALPGVLGGVLVPAGAAALAVGAIAAVANPYAWNGLLILVLVPAPFFVAGVLARRHAPAHPVTLTLLGCGAGGAAKIAVEYLVFRGGPPAAHLGTVTLVIAADCLLLVLFVRLVALVPDGRPGPRYERVVLGALWAYPVLPLLSELTAHPVSQTPRMFDTPGRVLLLLGPLLLAVRYRRAGAEERLAMRWIWLACVVWCLSYLLVAVPVTAGLIPASDPVYVLGWLDMLRCALISGAVLAATVRRRLFDVDVALRRTLVFGGCWLAVAAGYVAAAGALGAVAARELPLHVAVLATAVVTLALHPVRSRLTAAARERLLDPPEAGTGSPGDVLRRRLHDGVQQELVVLAAKLRLARNRLDRGEDPGALLVEAQDDAARAIESVRAVAHAAPPVAPSSPIEPVPTLTDALAARLRALPLALDLTVDGPPRRYPPAVTESAVLLVAEAVANVLKHADARAVAVRVRLAGELLHLEITDD